MTYIIIVSDSSLTSWVHDIPPFLRDNKTMYINIYLHTLHYFNLFGLSRCPQVTWRTIQHQACERSISFLHYLQCKNIVLFSGILEFFKYMYQLLNSFSTDLPPFIEWLTVHLCLRKLSTFSSFSWVLCIRLSVHLTL